MVATHNHQKSSPITFRRNFSDHDVDAPFFVVRVFAFFEGAFQDYPMEKGMVSP